MMERNSFIGAIEDLDYELYQSYSFKNIFCYSLALRVRAIFGSSLDKRLISMRLTGDLCSAAEPCGEVLSFILVLIKLI